MEESLELLANIERLILTATFVPRAAILHTYIIYRLHRCNIIVHEYAHAVEVQLILMNVPADWPVPPDIWNSLMMPLCADENGIS